MIGCTTLLTDKQGIPTRNPIIKIAYGIFQGSYVITGTLLEIESLYCHIKQDFGISFKVWFPNKSYFTDYKLTSKPLSKFRRLDVYGNPTGAIPEDYVTA